MPHIVRKLSTRDTTLLHTSPQSEVYTQSYGPPKLQKSQFWEFRDSHLGVLKQNDIWMLVMWPSVEYTIRGKLVASPSPGRGESCESMLARCESMHQKCSNSALTNLLFGLCRSVWVIDLVVNLPRPHPGALARTSTPKVLWARECALILSPSDVCHLWTRSWIHQGA
jgi:hypothetical protein